MRISDWSSDVCSSDLDRMRHHRVDEGVVVETFVAEAEVREGRSLFAQQRTRGDAGAPDKLLKQCARRRCLQIFDDMRLDARIANHRKRVARRAAFRIVVDDDVGGHSADRSEEHTSELQSLMRTSYASFRLKKKIRVSMISIITT